MATGCLLAGCGNKGTDGTQPQGLPNKPSASAIAEVESNPHIPADRKAGIIALMKGEAVSTAPPAGFVSPAGSMPKSTR